MKKKLILIILSFSILSCSKQKTSLNSASELKKNSSVKAQKYELKTIENQIIKTEKGTEIYYNRKDFNLNEKDNVILTIKEYYSFEDLVFNNIQTVTSDNKLLESSGVLNITFEVNNNIIELRKEKYLKIKFPGNKLKGNNLFSGNIDSLGQMNWDLLKQETPITENHQVVVSQDYLGNKKIRTITDTIAYIPGDYYKVDSLFKPINNTNQIAIDNVILTNKLGWINIDRFIQENTKIEFEIVVNKKELSELTTYVVYENLNSFISLFHSPSNFHFKKVPYLKGKTSIVTIGFYESKIFANKSKLLRNGKIEAKMKEIEIFDFKEMMGI